MAGTAADRLYQFVEGWRADVVRQGHPVLSPLMLDEMTLVEATLVDFALTMGWLNEPTTVARLRLKFVDWMLEAVPSSKTLAKLLENDARVDHGQRTPGVPVLWQAVERVVTHAERAAQEQAAEAERVERHEAETFADAPRF